jgi:SM-20-related protein
VRERQVSAVIFLNSAAEARGPESYSGGALTFYGLIDGPCWRGYGFPLVGEQGLLIAFRSDVLHEVTVVTRGERYSIVTWFF